MVGTLNVDRTIGDMPGASRTKIPAMLTPTVVLDIVIISGLQDVLRNLTHILCIP
ncbi:unnamed protein product [Somion occarium]|uniref:Uncharacterized protein n=1 Tax=Somion occarium TaxID=3059160 RepID=A0ABP1DK52_9APHY